MYKNVWVSVCTSACTVCTSVRTSACTYVCVYVCLYVHLCICVRTSVYLYRIFQTEYVHMYVHHVSVSVSVHHAAKPFYYAGLPGHSRPT